MAPRTGTIDVPVARPIPRTRAKAVTPKWLDAILLTIVTAMAVQVLVAIVPMFWGWYPVFGRSMQPTLPQLWGYCKVVPADPRTLRPGDIVMLDGGTLGYSVKRNAETRSDGLWVLGDNTDRSRDSSDADKRTGVRRQAVVPFSEVRGKVVAIWSPRRAWRSLTTAGRWQNEVEFEYPGDHVRAGEGFIALDPQKNVVLLRHGCAPVTLGKTNGRMLRESVQFRRNLAAIPCDRLLAIVDTRTYKVDLYPNSGTVAMAQWDTDTRITVRVSAAIVTASGSRPAKNDDTVTIR